MGGRKKKVTILGQDPDVLLAVWANILSWLVHRFAPSLIPKLLPECEQEDKTYASLMEGEDGKDGGGGGGGAGVDLRTRCISIGRPGGVEQLRLITLKAGVSTCGYNVEGQDIPFTKPLSNDGGVLPADCVLIRNEAFSVNYADCCIRWGLYESAKEYVGYPIVPGFDVGGVVERVGADCGGNFKVGDRVFGCSLFGAYSSRVLVPAVQLRRVPPNMSTAEAASIPAVALTSLYALFLAGHYPPSSPKNRFRNRSILIHSAAGGVGGMLAQMSKILGLHPVVGVVGRASKVDAAKASGCDVVIDKSGPRDLWESALEASPDGGGYATVMDPNGVSTLRQSYDHLAMTGRLIVFGFHTNLPMGNDMLSPLEWIRMARKMADMPKFDPMEMGASNKAVLAFNLSFFADEREMLSDLFDQVCEWLEGGKLKRPRIAEMNMTQIADAHNLIQSGASVGKIMLTTARERDN